MCKVSVIIPVYNMEKYLIKCLNSVVNQTYSDIEVLIIDDGSTDSSPLICDKYENDYSCVKTYHKSNGGLCSARNYGINKSKGEWLLFVDSDDWCALDYIQNLIIKTEEFKEADCILSSVYWQESDMKFYVRHQTFPNDGFYNDEDDMKILQAISLGNMFAWKGKWSDQLDIKQGNAQPWNKLYKREIIEKYHLRFDENTKVMEDALFNMNYFQFVKSVAYVDAKGYYYRYVNSGITKGFDLQRLNKEKYFFEQVEDYTKIHSENNFFDVTKKVKAVRASQELCIWVAKAKGNIKYSNIKDEVHQYLHTPMLYYGIRNSKLTEFRNIKSWLPILFARFEMVHMMYFAGKILLYYKNSN